MKITSVKFARLVSTGNFSNITIGAEAQVQENETPYDALTHLQGWVNDQIERRENEEHNQRQNEVDAFHATQELQELQRKLDTFRRRYNNAKSFLQKHGLSTSDWADEDPFADE